MICAFGTSTLKWQDLQRSPSNSRHSPALIPTSSRVTVSPFSIRRSASIPFPEICTAFRR